MNIILKCENLTAKKIRVRNLGFLAPQEPYFTVLLIPDQRLLLGSKSFKICYELNNSIQRWIFSFILLIKIYYCGLCLSLSQYQGIEPLFKVVYMMIDPISATSMKVSWLFSCKIYQFLLKYVILSWFWSKLWIWDNIRPCISDY